MEGLIFRGAYIRNGLSVSEYGGVIHRGLILGGRGLYSEVYSILLSNVSHIYIYTRPESTDLGHPFRDYFWLYSQSKILSRRVYSVCMQEYTLLYVQDFRNFISRLNEVNNNLLIIGFI